MNASRRRAEGAIGWVTMGTMLTSVAFAQAPVASSRAVERPDPVCETLFRDYACGGKINTADRDAATVLVASRGRANGYWQEVLKMLREADRPQVELSAVRVLGKMLAVDGRGREILEQQRRGVPYRGQWAGPYVVLGDEVVAELLKRLSQFESRRDHRIPCYVEALAAARAPAAREALLEVVSNGEPAQPGSADGYGTECCLFAAIGLARMREPAGVEWLIEHCESDTRLNSQYPLRREYDQLGSACCRALGDCRNANTPEPETRAAWQAWWNQAKRGFETVGESDRREEQP